MSQKIKLPGMGLVDKSRVKIVPHEIKVTDIYRISMSEQELLKKLEEHKKYEYHRDKTLSTTTIDYTDHIFYQTLTEYNLQFIPGKGYPVVKRQELVIAHENLIKSKEQESIRP